MTGIRIGFCLSEGFFYSLSIAYLHRYYVRVINLDGENSPILFCIRSIKREICGLIGRGRREALSLRHFAYICAFNNRVTVTGTRLKCVRAIREATQNIPILHIGVTQNPSQR
jgi:hypothetical protein